MVLISLGDGKLRRRVGALLYLSYVGSSAVLVRIMVHVQILTILVWKGKVWILETLTSSEKRYMNFWRPGLKKRTGKLHILVWKRGRVYKGFGEPNRTPPPKIPRDNPPPPPPVPGLEYRDR